MQTSHLQRPNNRRFGILSPSMPGAPGQGLPQAPAPRGILSPGAQAPDPVLTSSAQQDTRPKAPPRSTNPWAKENLSRTLADIGQAFLSNQNNFFSGLGAAGQSVHANKDRLKAEAAGTREFGVGPEGQFEIHTDAEGNRTISKIPEFAQAIEDKRDADREARVKAPDPKDIVDLRARAINAVMKLPPEQRSGAYAAIMNNPQAYGGFDTTGMPGEWNDTYGTLMAGMGQTVNQAQGQDYRERTFQHRQAVDERRLGQTDQRIGITAARGSGGGGGRSGRGRSGRPRTSAPAGFNWD